VSGAAKWIPRALSAARILDVLRPGIRYEGEIYRPPSEASSLILQATIGCSYNRCTFCGMYRDKRFRVRPLEELANEIDWAARHLGLVRKVFLADGDALVAKSSFLLELLDSLRQSFPALQRVSVYASPQSLQVRTVDEMIALLEAGLSLYYLGIESGHDAVLADLEKGVDSAEMVQVARKATEAGVKLSTMILLGAGGRRLSLEHARESARVVNAIQPRFLSTLVMTSVEGTPLHATRLRGEVDELDPVELARELRELIAGLDLEATVFRSNHASNYLTLEGTLPRDRERLLGALDRVLSDPAQARFVPEWMRGL
jgi:radical SAM superfamily enzyme YgiQ (UPF0313 family)